MAHPYPSFQSISNLATQLGQLFQWNWGLDIKLFWLIKSFSSEICLQAVDSNRINVCIKLVSKEVVMLDQPLQVPSAINTYASDVVAMARGVHRVYWILWPFMQIPLHQPCKCIHVCDIIFTVGPMWARNTGNSLNGCPNIFIGTVGVFEPLYECLYFAVFQHTADVASTDHNVGISWLNGQIKGRWILGFSCVLEKIKFYINLMMSVLTRFFFNNHFINIDMYSKCFRRNTLIVPFMISCM